MRTNDLQTWSPYKSELAAAEAAASSTIARRGPPLCSQTAEIGMRLVIRAAAPRGSAVARGSAILIGWRSEGKAHGDCTGGLSTDDYCRVHFTQNDHVVVERGICTPESIRVDMRVTTVSVYKTQSGELFIYHYISCESFSQFDSPPLTSLTRTQRQLSLATELCAGGKLVTPRSVTRAGGWCGRAARRGWPSTAARRGTCLSGNCRSSMTPPRWTRIFAGTFR